MTINKLPPEVLVKILSFLTQKDLLFVIRNVCHIWRDLTTSMCLWNYVEYIYEYRKDKLNRFYRSLAKHKLVNHIVNLKITEELFWKLLKYDKHVKFASLKSIDISADLLRSGKIFAEICNRCPCLESIKIWAVVGVDVKNMFKVLSKKKFIDFDVGYYNEDKQQDFDKHFLSFLATQPNIQQLSLRTLHSHDEHDLARIIEGNPHITTLCLSSNYVSNQLFKRLHLNLTKIAIHSNLFDDQGLEWLTSRSNQLVSINVKDCETITDRGISFIGQNCPSLENLTFGNHMQTKIGNDGLLSVAQGCPKLKTLHTHFIWNINDDSVVLLAKSCTFLQKVSFEKGAKFTDASLMAIGDNCPLLKFALFKECDELTKDGVLYLITSCIYMETLEITCCRGIGLDQSNANLRNTSSTITGRLNCAENIQIETSGASTKKHSHLKRLNLFGCLNTSNETLLYLVKHCPDLQYLSRTNTSIQCNEQLMSELLRMCSLLDTTYL